MARAVQPLILTKVHIAILFTILFLGGCATQHILDRNWFGVRWLSRVHKAIKDLEDAGFIVRRRLPSRTEVGSGQYWLNLTRLGRDVLKELGASAETVDCAPKYPPLYTFLHDIQVRDVALILERATQGHPQVTLASWMNEHELRRAPFRVPDSANPASAPSEAVPDAAFTLALGNGSRKRLFLEVDRETVGPLRLRERLRTQLTWLPTHAKGSPVLFVVPTPKRQAQIAALAAAVAEKLSTSPRLFWIAQADQVTATTILAEPIWSVVGGPLVTLLPPAVGQSG
jgi:hypothetical protein